MYIVPSAPRPVKSVALKSLVGGAGPGPRQVSKAGVLPNMLIGVVWRLWKPRSSQNLELRFLDTL